MRVLTFGFFLSILYFQIYCVQCKIKTEDEECEKYCKTLNGFITKHCGIICLTYGSAETRYCVLACSMKAHSVNAFYKCVDPCYHEPKSNATFCGKSDENHRRSPYPSRFLCGSSLCLLPHCPLSVALSSLLQSGISLPIVDRLSSLPSSLRRIP
uniref:Uncharacterized protein n=1 Tax=Trichobilharzia regenti TaxID=157069 RepID=A0AA85KBS0_TRIRE|nr:unnamed protein product [Trichobilharzia regenti]